MILLHGGLGHSRQLGLSGARARRARLSRGCDRQPRPRPQHARRAAVQLRADGVRRTRAVMDAPAHRAGGSGRLERRRVYRLGARRALHPSASRVCSSLPATWIRAARRTSNRARSDRRRCFGRHVKDYARLSATPDQFEAFADAVGLMQRTAAELLRRTIWPRSACRSRSCRASTTSSSSANTPSIWRAVFPTRSWWSCLRRESFRAAAAAGLLQRRDASVCRTRFEMNWSEGVAI